MQDSTTTNSKDFSFSFAEPKPVFEPTPLSQPYLAGPGRWDNYTDDKLYEMECLLRAFLETKKHGWGTSNESARKFTAKMMNQILYGTDEMAASEIKRMNRLLTYYCVKKYSAQRSAGKDNRTTIYGKMQHCNVYKLSARKADIKPYSLRLRLEWLELQGKLPTYENMGVE